MSLFLAEKGLTEACFRYTLSTLTSVNYCIYDNITIFIHIRGRGVDLNPQHLYTSIRLRYDFLCHVYCSNAIHNNNVYICC